MAKARARSETISLKGMWIEEAARIQPISAPYAAGRVALRAFTDVARALGDHDVLQTLATVPAGAEQLPPGFEDIARVSRPVGGRSLFSRYPSIFDAMARVGGYGVRAVAESELGLWAVRDRRGHSPELEEIGRGIVDRVLIPDSYKGAARGEVWLVRIGSLEGHHHVVLSVPIVLRGVTEDAVRAWVSRETGLRVGDLGTQAAYRRWANDIPRWASQLPPLYLNQYATHWEIDGAVLLAGAPPKDSLGNTLSELFEALTPLHWAALGRGEVPLAAAVEKVQQLAIEALSAWTGGSTPLRGARITQIERQLSTLRPALENTPGLSDRVLPPLFELLAWAHYRAGAIALMVRALGHARVGVLAPKLQGLPAKDQKAIYNALAVQLDSVSATTQHARWFAYFTPSERLIQLATSMPRLALVLIESAGTDVDQLLRLDSAGLSCRGPLVRGLATAGRWPEAFERLFPWPEGVRVDELLELAQEADQIEALRDLARKRKDPLSIWLAADEAPLLGREPRTLEPLLDLAAYAAARLSGGELLLPAGNEWLSPRLLLLMANLSGDHDPDRCRELAYRALSESFGLSVAFTRLTQRQMDAARAVLSRYRQLCDWEGDQTRRDTLRSRFAASPNAMLLLEQVRL